ncbi:hypothetical protein EQG63_02600 [Flavobacterium amnicola]|uniref:Quinol oxidase subunit 4 n=1 Tax=Flavobacterium amnicola TaxID=2506422 RepID=A0A4Q1K626_9FLAO|nr:hypothetical protein [Flavobacterium amnicola]RXR20845.1 hypothetical protein EQG63_02600 [Flavobacterium amnicola]
MKNIFLSRISLAVLFLLAATTLTNCVHVHDTRKTVVVKQKPLPPGQAKKIYGDKSAKKHAPGHNK